jgi:hypothetical protein
VGELAEFLRSTELFGSVDVAALEELLPDMSEVELSAGEVLSSRENFPGISICCRGVCALPVTMGGISRGYCWTCSLAKASARWRFFPTIRLRPPFKLK